MRAVVLSCLLTIGTWLVAPDRPLLDDSYIPLHAAHVIVNGGVDPTYGSPALIGVTSVPYVAVLVPLVWAQLSDSTVFRTMNALSILAFAGAVLALGCAFDLRWRHRWALVAVAFATGVAQMHLVNGLETGLAMAAGIATVAAAISRRTVILACLLGLLPCLRTDLAFLAAAIWLYVMLDASTRDRVWLIVVPILIAAPWVAWMYHDTGRLLPNTIGAKRAFYAEGCEPWREKARLLSRNLAFWAVWVLPVLVLAWHGIRSTRLGRFLAVAALLSVLPFLVALPDGVRSNGFRYLYPLAVPMLLYGIAACHAGFSRVRLVTAAVLAVLILPIQILQWRGMLAFSADLHALQTWVTGNVPPTSTIATHDAGILSMGPHRLVDLVGLKTPDSAVQHEAHTWPSCGASRGEALRAILQQHPADYLVVATEWDDTYHFSTALSASEVVRPPRAPGYVYKVYRLPPRLSAQR